MKNLYEESIQRQIDMCSGNIERILNKIKNMDIEYLEDIVLLTEACGWYGDTEFEIIDFEYIKNYPTLITNKIDDGLSGKGFNVKMLRDILSSLSNEEILCVNTGFKNDSEDDINGIMNCYIHNIYDLKSEDTKKIYGNYAFELIV